MTSILIAKASLLAALAAYLALFLGARRAYRPLCAALVVAMTITLGSAAFAFQPEIPLGGFSTTGLVILLAIGGLALLAGATWLAWRFPTWAVPVAVALAPLRVPLPAGGSSVYALAPLYLAIAAILGAEVVLRNRFRPPLPRLRNPLRVALGVLIGIATASSLWAGLDYVPRTTAFAAALVEILAFYLPFGILFALTWRQLTSQTALHRLMAAIVATGVVLAVVGIVQYFVRFTIFNRETILRELALGHGFRINSLLWDPNMLSRWLLVAIMSALALAIALPHRRPLILTCAGLALIADGLTFSRSGWLLLVLAVLSLTLLTLRRYRKVALLCAMVLLVGSTAGFVLLRDTPVTTKMLHKPWSINRLTGGRYYLVQSGLEMFAAHPLSGVGIGAFPQVYENFRDRHASPRLKASHTTPVTALAEGGIPGILSYVAVLITLGLATVRAVRRADTGNERVQAAVVAIILAALFLHSLVYNAFFEDAAVWILMAVASALAGRRLHPNPTLTSSTDTAATS